MIPIGFPKVLEDIPKNKKFVSQIRETKFKGFGHLFSKQNIEFDVYFTPRN